MLCIYGKDREGNTGFFDFPEGGGLNLKTISFTIPSILGNETVYYNLSEFPNAGFLFKYSSSSPARIRLYTNPSSRENDLNRPDDEFPSGYHNNYFDHFTSVGNLSRFITRSNPFFNETGIGYFSITNGINETVTNLVITLKIGV